MTITKKSTKRVTSSTISSKKKRKVVKPFTDVTNTVSVENKVAKENHEGNMTCSLSVTSTSQTNTPPSTSSKKKILDAGYSSERSLQFDGESVHESDSAKGYSRADINPVCWAETLNSIPIYGAVTGLLDLVTLGSMGIRVEDSKKKDRVRKFVFTYWQTRDNVFTNVAAYHLECGWDFAIDQRISILSTVQSEITQHCIAFVNEKHQCDSFESAVEEKVMRNVSKAFDILETVTCKLSRKTKSGNQVTTTLGSYVLNYLESHSRRDIALLAMKLLWNPNNTRKLKEFVEFPHFVSFLTTRLGFPQPDPTKRRRSALEGLRAIAHTVLPVLAVTLKDNTRNVFFYPKVRKSHSMTWYSNTPFYHGWDGWDEWDASNLEDQPASDQEWKNGYQCRDYTNKERRSVFYEFILTVLKKIRLLPHDIPINEFLSEEHFQALVPVKIEVFIIATIIVRLLYPRNGARNSATDKERAKRNPGKLEARVVCKSNLGANLFKVVVEQTDRFPVETKSFNRYHTLNYYTEWMTRLYPAVVFTRITWTKNITCASATKHQRIHDYRENLEPVMEARQFFQKAESKRPSRSRETDVNRIAQLQNDQLISDEFYDEIRDSDLE